MKKCIPSIKPSYWTQHAFIKLARIDGHTDVYWNDVMDQYPRSVTTLGCYYCSRCSTKWDEDGKEINSFKR